MARKTVVPILLLLLLLFPNCREADMRGMAVPYQLVDERFQQSMAWNKTHPIAEILSPSNAYEVFVMGDSHVGGIENLKKFFQTGIQANSRAFVMAGDLTTGHSEDYQVFQDALEWAKPVPTFPIIGNHDLFFNGWEEFKKRFGSSVYYFIIKTPDYTDLYVCLDTGGGTLGKEQLSWLKKLLQNERPIHRHCFLFTHQNLIRTRPTLTTNPMPDEVHELLELFLLNEVNLYVAGHDHKPSEVKYGNTSILTLDALLDKNPNAGYLVLNVGENKSFTYDFVRMK